MSKTKASGAGHYEMLFIVPNKFTEEEAKKIIAKVSELINKNTGDITYTEYWGKKKLAYKIADNEFGYYALYEFDMDRKSLIAFDRILRLDNEILRHQIVKTEKKTAEQIAKEKKEKEKAFKAEKENAVEEEKVKKPAKVSVKKELEKTEEEQVAEEKKKEDDLKKVDLKDLDKKLDDILDTGDLL